MQKLLTIFNNTPSTVTTVTIIYLLYSELVRFAFVRLPGLFPSVPVLDDVGLNGEVLNGVFRRCSFGEPYSPLRFGFFARRANNWPMATMSLLPALDPFLASAMVANFEGSQSLWFALYIEFVSHRCRGTLPRLAPELGTRFLAASLDDDTG